ncbi:hypothetical protein BN844_4891 [Pseudomonas sp. SHC52]|nr:hypothetical protein BN844_4891 [Pseudomonas sp. SHC52]
MFSKNDTGRPTPPRLENHCGPGRCLLPSIYNTSRIHCGSEPARDKAGTANITVA